MKLHIHSPEYRKNPYPIFRRLRAEYPVSRIEPLGHWLIAKYSDVVHVLKNPQLFSSARISEEPKSGSELILKSRSLVGCDKPEHTRLRGLISKAIAPTMVRELEPQIRSLAKSLIAKFVDKDTFDFVRDFSMPLPVIVISELLGIDPERRDDFKRWSDMLITWRNTSSLADIQQRQHWQAQIKQDTEQMFNYLNSIIAERQSRPRADLISTLVQSCENDHALSPDEVLGFVRFLLVAGNETTTNLLGNTILALLDHPDQWEIIKKDKSKIPLLVEESLRFDSPALSLIRRATANTEISGIKITKGDLVLPLLGSANHDETIFSDPERFNIERNVEKHLAFGTGIHFCLGSPLARLQARIAMEELVSIFANFIRADAAPLERIESFFFRGVKNLRLVGTWAWILIFQFSCIVLAQIGLIFER